MIDWFTILQVAVATAAGVLCLVLGLLGRRPSDLSVGATAIVELLLIVQLAVAIVSPQVGNSPSGNLLEYYLYLISALLLPLAAGFWALIERSRWSTVILGIICISIAVMVYRMHHIWYT
ncbi:hypothetical protein C5C66_07610 [Rathayibacter toxicus]|uniref:Membrane protein n=1 Tax=Rathayibacter toxicus TaxID=145458 RepID=A0A0C5BT67_9MICO|nr:hypothetical protein [Rathayibacter toxicus]AJM77872.1 membrane protein [Rathayibacter toxicus]ALS57936.1 hypothetical protein APU90_09315 [Rathayibacter toxicus]KKM46873.1 membrane protein [Rathayibacter toxicus]PPG20381.1 hypothetical protein C5D15_07610 [Rathayibacter toxicus]PPG45483.1 hypothetical protein C5D16_07580 [Rathayibacter toxicus]